MAHLDTCKRLFSRINLVYSTQKAAAFSLDPSYSLPVLRKFLLVCFRKCSTPIAIPSSVSTQFPWQCALFIAPTDLWAHTLARVWGARAGVWCVGASRDAIKQREQWNNESHKKAHTVIAFFSFLLRPAKWIPFNFAIERWGWAARMDARQQMEEINTTKREEGGK